MQLTQPLAAARFVDQSPSASARYHFLDYLRALAALSVFAAHAFSEVSPVFYRFRFTVFDLGTYGVMVFFLCSGFIIPASLERHRTLSSFWCGRFFRLYPLYWLSIALVLLLHVFGFEQSLADGSQLSTEAILANLTMLQAFFGYGHLLTLYWTLSFEMAFYISVSLLAALGLSRRVVPVTLTLIAAAVLVESVLPTLMGSAAPLGLVSCLATMFVGSTAQQFSSGELSSRRFGLIGALAILMLIATSGLASVVGGGSTYVFTASIAAYVTFAGALLFARSSKTRRFGLLPAFQITQYLGVISYSIYLMHPLVLLVVPTVGGPLTSVLTWLAVVLVGSALTYQWIELPGIAIGRRLTTAARR